MVRNRIAVIGAILIGLAVVACLLWSAVQHRDGEKPNSTPQGHPDDLSAEDETALQAIVAKHFLAVANWAPGGVNPRTTLNRYEVLVLPKRVREIFDRKPVATLRVLKRIIESGTADDGYTAIAYAHAAVGYANDDPVHLGIARIYASHPTAKKFDEMAPVIPKTYRQSAVEEIDELILEVTQKKPGQLPTPK